MGPEYRRQNRYRKTNQKRNLTIIIAMIVLIAGVGGFFWWQGTHRRDPLVSQSDYQSDNPQTALGNESKQDDDSSNTSAQNQQLAATASPTPAIDLPTPSLSKSSGNNGSIPSDAAVEFVCTAPSGYSCSVMLTGPKSTTLSAKSLVPDSRGQTPSVSWTWTSEKGSWKAQAKLTDNKGHEKSSPTQNLEVI